MNDHIFFNGSTMSASQIQAFLNAKVPTCDSNGDKPYGGTTRKKYAASKGVSTPFICLKGYIGSTTSKSAEPGLCKSIGGRSNRTAAEIIDEVARACNVSQKALIVLLQKEQGLVTDDWPWPVQYQKATGYGCPDTAPCDSQYYGFFNQVYNAARQFKRYAQNPDNYNYRAARNNYIQWHPNGGCGGSTVYIENQTTAGLFNYTPYRPNSAALNNLYGSGDGCSAYGNRNFWRYYSDWFGNTLSSPFFRINNSSAIYVLGSDNNYYHVASAKVLSAYGYSTNSKDITSVGSGYVSGLTLVGSLPTIARFEGDAIYLIDENKKYHFTSQDLLNRHGFSIGNEALLPSWMHTYYASGGNMQEVVKLKGGSPRYSIENGKKRHISSQAAYDSGSPAYSSKPIVELSSFYLSILPEGAPILVPNMLLKKSNNTYGFWDGSKLQSISPQTVSELGLIANYASSSSAINQLPSGNSVIVKLVKNSSNQLFLFDNKKKYVIQAGDLTEFGLSSTSFVTTSDNLIARVPTENMSFVIRVNNSTAVYLIREGERRHATSRNALSENGFSITQAKGLNTTSSAIFPLSAKKIISTGTLYRIGSTSPIYLINSNASSLYIPSKAILYEFGFSLSSVLSLSSSEIAGYPSAGKLNYFVKNSANQASLIQKGMVKHSAAESVYGTSHFNIAPESIYPLSDYILNKYSSGPQLSEAIRSKGDTKVYLIQSGKKRWVTSRTALASAGYDMNDVVSLSPSYVATIPLGSNIN